MRNSFSKQGANLSVGACLSPGCLIGNLWYPIFMAKNHNAAGPPPQLLP